MSDDEPDVEEENEPSSDLSTVGIPPSADSTRTFDSGTSSQTESGFAGGFPNEGFALDESSSPAESSSEAGTPIVTKLTGTELEDKLEDAPIVIPPEQPAGSPELWDSTHKPPPEPTWPEDHIHRLEDAEGGAEIDEKIKEDSEAEPFAVP